MASASVLTKPHKKRRVNQPDESPFPIPIETLTHKQACNGYWFYYKARMINNSVVVQNEGDISFLNKMGFFGKGILSRSKPEHQFFASSFQGLQRKNLPPKERRFQQQRFQQIRQHKYERHLSWKKLLSEQKESVAEHALEVGNLQEVPKGPDYKYPMMPAKKVKRATISVRNHRAGIIMTDRRREKSDSRNRLGPGNENEIDESISSYEDLSMFRSVDPSTSHLLHLPGNSLKTLDVLNANNGEGPSTWGDIKRGLGQFSRSNLDSRTMGETKCGDSGERRERWKDDEGGGGGGGGNEQNIHKFNFYNSERKSDESAHQERTNLQDDLCGESPVERKDKISSKSAEDQMDDGGIKFAQLPWETKEEDWMDILVETARDVGAKKSSASSRNDSRSAASAALLTSRAREWGLVRDSHQPEETRQEDLVDADMKEEGDGVSGPTPSVSASKPPAATSSWTTDMKDWGAVWEESKEAVLPLIQSNTTESKDNALPSLETSGTGLNGRSSHSPESPKNMQSVDTLNSNNNQTVCSSTSMFHVPSVQSSSKEAVGDQKTLMREGSMSPLNTGASQKDVLPERKRKAADEEQASSGPGPMDLEEDQELSRDQVLKDQNLDVEGSIQIGPGEAHHDQSGKEGMPIRNGAVKDHQDKSAYGDGDCSHGQERNEETDAQGGTLDMDKAEEDDPSGDTSGELFLGESTELSQSNVDEAVVAVPMPVDYDNATTSQTESNNLLCFKGRNVRKKTRDTKPPVRNTDPYPIFEYLQLSYEEAFFLSYGLGCLSVENIDQRPMDLTEMWRLFCRNQPKFVPHYIAYHYFRSKGWVPKTGLKFGADFILYKKGPPFYHASYCVCVSLLNEEDIDQGSLTKMTWASIIGMDRVIETASKELMLCFVIKPRSLTKCDLESPACIPRFRVQEILLRRWLPTRNRDQLPNETEIS